MRELGETFLRTAGAGLLAPRRARAATIDKAKCCSITRPFLAVIRGLPFCAELRKPEGKFVRAGRRLLPAGRLVREAVRISIGGTPAVRRFPDEALEDRGEMSLRLEAYRERDLDDRRLGCGEHLLRPLCPAPQ